MLKAIRLNKRKELKFAELEELKLERNEHKARADDLETRIDGVASEADLEKLESEIDEILEKIAEHDEAISTLEQEIDELESDISALEESQDRAAKRAASSQSTGGDGKGAMNGDFNLRAKTDFEKRERMRQVLEAKENHEFYERVAEVIKNRGVSNTDLLIPKIIVDMINVDMLDVGKIYSLVTVRQIPGTSRIVMSGDTPEAIWLDNCGPLSELKLDFSMLELDGYKVGGFIAICNATLEDAFIDLALHIQEQITKAIAVAIDKAIVNGKGSKDKQPTGIIPSLPTSSKMTCTSDFATVMSKFGELPDDASNLTAVMTRKTYYTHFAPQTITSTSAGQIVSQNTKGDAKLPDGTHVVFVNKSILEDDKMLLGDYKKYFLAQRAGLQLARSEEHRFIQDQTVFKGTSRYDGRPIKTNYWILLALQAPQTPPAG